MDEHNDFVHIRQRLRDAIFEFATVASGLKQGHQSNVKHPSDPSRMRSIWVSKYATIPEGEVHLVDEGESPPAVGARVIKIELVS